MENIIKLCNCSSLSRMAVWQKRGYLFKVGFTGVILGVLLFVVGFCAPSWARFSLPWGLDNSQSMGLWQACTVDLSICVIAVDSDNPGWLKAVRALECIAMFFAVAACIMGVYCNFILKVQFSTDIFNKNMETSAVASVIFSTFGLIIFATQVHNMYSNQVGRISWGFLLVCVANAFLGIGAFLMLISNKLHLMALQNHFAHRQLNNSVHSHVQFPDYAVDGGGQVFIASPEGHVDFGPPAYDTVVNCIPQDEAAPPPYSQVVKLNE